MLNYARHLRGHLTNAETLLWARLRRRQLGKFRFRRQHTIGPYICDFVCPEATLVVELDGSQHVDAAAYDARRDAFLRSHGYRVLRFWNGTVLDEIDGVVETIYQALRRKEMGGRID